MFTGVWVHVTRFIYASTIGCDLIRRSGEQQHKDEQQQSISRINANRGAYTRRVCFSLHVGMYSKSISVLLAAREAGCNAVTQITNKRDLHICNMYACTMFGWCMKHMYTMYSFHPIRCQHRRKYDFHSSQRDRVCSGSGTACWLGWWWTAASEQRPTEVSNPCVVRDDGL